MFPGILRKEEKKFVSGKFAKTLSQSVFEQSYFAVVQSVTARHQISIQVLEQIITFRNCSSELVQLITILNEST